MVEPDGFFLARRSQIIVLAARYAVPTVYSNPEFAKAGGLMSYSADLAESYRQAGLYIGRILKGENPADLPVLRPTKFVFAINLQSAKTLGLTIPETLLATADEVIQ